MMRVAFILSAHNKVWNGGLNYYRNVLSAICELPDSKITPVVFVGSRMGPSFFKGYPDVEIVKSTVFDRFYPQWFLQRSIDRLFSRDILIERLLRKHNIDLLSHSFYALSPSSGIPMCSWITDFQPLHFPDFFPREEIARRERELAALGARSARIIVSSFDARKDLIKTAPEMGGKSRVLQFVSRLDRESAASSLGALQRKYDFEGQFFLLPNQFWIHKNHRVVVEALRILNSRKQNLLVLATGRQCDNRRPDYYRELMQLVRGYGVSQNFRPLGEIPYSDLTGLMANAISMMNPSLFEGWSTSVEEAKSLGKHMILSDIPVHREQNPPEGNYFNPDDAEALADILWRRTRTCDPSHDANLMARAKEEFPRRWRKFGKTYSDIVTEVLQ